jgi:hypothetical protein
LTDGISDDFEVDLNRCALVIDKLNVIIRNSYIVVEGLIDIVVRDLILAGVESEEGLD